MNPKKKTRAQKLKQADARLLRAARRWLRWFHGSQSLFDEHCRLARAIEARLKLEPKGKR